MNMSGQQDLSAILHSEIDCSNVLMQFLTQEATALAEHNVAALQLVIQDKQNIILQLERLGQQREAILAASDADLLGESPELSNLWQKLLTVAGQCQQKNRINGSVIELGYRQSKQALDILKGGATQSELYNNSGQTTQSSRTSTIAKA